ncbi:MAG: hypothetical protein J5511_05440 [Bacilli bacterium]|nr:hypothetical protein [Bacilli bacterium]
MDYLFKTFNNPNIDDFIKLLNCPARDFYCGKLQFVDKTFFSKLKSNLLGAIIDIERTIRGTFGCDLSMVSINEEMFARMYPNACLNMFRVNGVTDYKKISYFLSSIRNINAHAFIGDNELGFLESDFSFLNKQKSFNTNIQYLVDDDITIAGIIFIILNFLRSQSINTMVTDDFFIGLVSSGKYEKDDGTKFVDEISHTNLEIDIRQVTGDNITSSIFGELFKNTIVDRNHYSISIGKETYPTFRINCEISNNIIIVKKESLTRAFYKAEYKLEIINEKDFIRLSNLLPPFSLIDYLYESHISVFDTKAKDFVESHLELISKINKPKFYADKSLFLLVFGEKASDFRITSSLMVDSISRIMLTLENLIYRIRKINRCNEYTSIKNALRFIEVPDSIVLEIVYLRNFSAHGYILNDYLIYKEDTRQFTLEYIIATIKNLLVYLEKHQKDVYNNLRQYIQQFMIDKIVRMKYKIAVNYSNIVISEYPNYDKQELKKKNGFINNSFFNITMFNQITCFDIQRVKALQVVLPDMSDSLYFYNNEGDRDKVIQFCNSFNFKINYEHDQGLISKIELVKI